MLQNLYESLPRKRYISARKVIYFGVCWDKLKKCARHLLRGTLFVNYVNYTLPWTSTQAGFCKYNGQQKGIRLYINPLPIQRGTVCVFSICTQRHLNLAAQEGEEIQLWVAGSVSRHNARHTSECTNHLCDLSLLHI